MKEEIKIGKKDVVACNYWKACDYYKQLKGLEQENAKFKAENELLREDYIKLYQQKDLDNVRWQKRCTDLHVEDKAKTDKYWLVLQEIKAIAKEWMNNDWSCFHCRNNMDEKLQDILDLITKSKPMRSEDAGFDITTIVNDFWNRNLSPDNLPLILTRSSLRQFVLKILKEKGLLQEEK